MTGVYNIGGISKELCGNVALSTASISRLRRSCYNLRFASKSAIISGRMVNNIDESI
jgi:hypothetical protein